METSQTSLTLEELVEFVDPPAPEANPITDDERKRDAEWDAMLRERGLVGPVVRTCR